MIAKLVYQI